MAEHPRRVDLVDDDGGCLVIHPPLTAYLDALDEWKRNPSVVTGIAVTAANTALARHVQINAYAVSGLLSLLADPATGGPHISPDAPSEVWRAWRDVMGVDNG